MSLLLGYGTVINEIDKVDLTSFIDYYNSQYINIYNKHNKIYIILNSTKVKVIEGCKLNYIEPTKEDLINIKYLLNNINDIYGLKLFNHGFYIF